VGESIPAVRQVGQRIGDDAPVALESHRDIVKGEELLDLRRIAGHRRRQAPFTFRLGRISNNRRTSENP